MLEIISISTFAVSIIVLHIRCVSSFCHQSACQQMHDIHEICMIEYASSEHALLFESDVKLGKALIVQRKLLVQTTKHPLGFPSRETGLGACA